MADAKEGKKQRLKQPRDEPGEEKRRPTGKAANRRAKTTQAKEEESKNGIAKTETRRPLPASSPVPKAKSSLSSSADLSTTETSPSSTPSPRDRIVAGEKSRTVQLPFTEDLRRKKVENVMKARLYFLQKTGPTSFSVGGDSPEHKYRVNVGPQTCSCGRGPYCVHVLFVMLRVLQMSLNHPLLWSKSLKNYEVEGLLAQFQARRTRMRSRSSSCSGSLGRHDSSFNKGEDDGKQAGSGGSQNTSLTSSGESLNDGDEAAAKEEKDGMEVGDEDVCPICLLEMVDGESLTICRDGCNNSLHHHCMAIWAQERNRLLEPVTCPLCLKVWHANVPPASPPQVINPHARMLSPFSTVRQGNVRLPTVDPLSEESIGEYAEWIKVFGKPLVACLLSNQWPVRETALNRLAQDVVAMLLRGNANGNNDGLSVETIVRTCCLIVTHCCSDPVFKVYVAALNVLHAILTTVSHSSDGRTAFLQDYLKPVIIAIIIKAADHNQRTSTRSLAVLKELCKCCGDEAATTTDSASSSSSSTGSVSFVLSCALDQDAGGGGQRWQWWQGRLVLLDMLLSEFPVSFKLPPLDGDDTGGAADLLAMATYTRLWMVMNFAATATNFQHMRVSKMARRVFVRAARFGAHIEDVLRRMRDLVATLQEAHRTTLSRRLSMLATAASSDDIVTANPAASRLTAADASPLMPSTPVGGEQEFSFRLDAGDEGGVRTAPVIAVSRHDSGVEAETAHSFPSLSTATTHESETNPMSRISSLASVVVRSGGGPCKDMDADEAEAVVQAMESSQAEQNLPVLSGLAPPDELVTVHIQNDVDGSPCDRNDGSNLYMEGIHWRKGPLIGTGAFCTVFQARDIKSGGLMALKQVSFCRNTQSEQEAVMAAITEEIAMMGRLDNPHIIRCLGATRQESHFNIFSEWMPGGSLASLLSKYGRFEEDVVQSYLRQLLRATAYLHDMRVIHRDIKGANLLVDSTGQHVRLCDFGTAARLATQQTMAGEFQGSLIGTVAFMAPEVLRGETYGRSCDVWSIGCTIIEMTTAKPPWGAADVTNHLALIFRIASANGPPPIPELENPALRDLLLRCLEVNPSDRPTASDLLGHPLYRKW